MPHPLSTAYRWFDRNILELGRELRLSYLPPLMVYMAAGISGLTDIVGTFFVKDYLGLSAEFLAVLGFWAGIPWTLKMPLGHLVDLMWRFKAGLVFLGASLIAASLAIMLGLLAHTEAMRAVMSVEAWFVLSAILGPVGYVVQDVVADAMTVEAVPRVDGDGRPIDPAARRLMHTTMQTLGRVAIIGGGVFVAAAQRRAVQRRRDDVRGGQGRRLHPDLRARPRHPDHVGAGRCAGRARQAAGHPPAVRAGLPLARGRDRRRVAPLPERPSRTGGSSAAGCCSSRSPSAWGSNRRPLQPGDHLRRARWRSSCS